MELLSAPPFELPKTFDAVDAAIDHNAKIAEVVLATGLEAYGMNHDSTEWHGAATPSDMDKVRSTIRQLYRDWSAEGVLERKACYEPMLEALDHFFQQVVPAERSEVSLLIPGAGLGRLVFEACKAGYRVEGNEISYHQLFVSNWILNYAKEARKWQLYPWALNFSNHTSRDMQLRKVSIPDLVVSNELDTASKRMNSKVHAYQRMSMAAGDFCVTYKHPDYEAEYDAALTCWFIDTAPNLIAYIDTVKHCLKPHGIWINHGPLLWHFESTGAPQKAKSEGDTRAPTSAGLGSASDQGIGEPGSFELTDEEVCQLVERCGFHIEEKRLGEAAGYIHDTESMMQSTYRPSFWVARRL